MRTRSLVAAVVGLLCLSAGTAAAQLTWEAGFRGGLGLGKIRGDTGFSESSSDGSGNTIDVTGDIKDFRIAFGAGAFVTAKINDSFGVRLEALYVQKGGKGPVDVYFNGTLAGTADITFKLDYVELPLLAVASFPAGTSAKVNLFGGPAVAVKTGANLRAEAQGQSDETDIGDTIESTDFGFAVGAGVAIVASPRLNILIDGRATLGLSKVPTTGEDIKNTNLLFTAGLSFPLGGGSQTP